MSLSCAIVAPLCPKFLELWRQVVFTIANFTH